MSGIRDAGSLMRANSQFGKSRVDEQKGEAVHKTHQLTASEVSCSALVLVLASMIMLFWSCSEACAQTQLRHFAQGDFPVVEMVAGDMKIHFDPLYGGNARHWYIRRGGQWSSESVIDPHPGKSMNSVFETGQDATQTSANGTDWHPIAMLGDPSSAPNAWYMSETVCDSTSPQKVYEVTGFAPFFWLSFDWIDDAIPPGATEGNGWFVFYQEIGPGCESVGNCHGRDLTQSGVPLWFDATTEHPSGILMLGNEKLPLLGQQPPDEYEWNERLCEIPDGRLAVKINVSLEQASNALAAIMFRRSVPAHQGANIDDAYASPGYFLTVNQAGVVQVLKSSGQGLPSTVWNGNSIPYAQASINTAEGTRLEIRTHNAIPETIWILVDGDEVGSYTDPAPILGPHFGLFAATAPGTSIKFMRRQVFDVGSQMVVRYTAYPDGYIDTDIEVRSAPSVTGSKTYYSHHTQVGFFNRGYGGGILDFAAAEDECGQYRDDFLFAGSCGAPCQLFGDCPTNPMGGGSSAGVMVAPILRQAPGMDVHWLGDTQKVHGLYMIPMLAEIDGHRAFSAFSQVDVKATGEVIAQVCPFEFRGVDPYYYPDLCSPFQAESFRIVNRWSLDLPTIELDLSVLRVEDRATGCETGSERHPFRTVGGAHNAATAGDTLRAEPGNYGENIVIDKQVVVESTGGIVRIGN